MIIKTLKLLLSFFLLSIIIVLSIINLRLHNTPKLLIENGDTVNHDLLAELRGLKNALDNNADADMQRLYPEGYVFLNTIYALTLTNFIDSLDKETLYFKEGYREVHNAWRRIDSETGRQTFQEIESPPFGAFYSGWNNYLLGRKLSLLNQNDRDTSEITSFKNQCEDLVTSFEKSVYPVSYAESAWPADAMMCIASLALHDKLFEPRYSQLISDWLSKVKTNLDENGLIPHSADPATGKPTENARGSSQSLMLIFLADIDREFAAQQFTLYKSLFFDTRFGLTGIREYPKSTTGTGDIDSGPIILEFGSAATLVGMHTLSLHGDHHLRATIRNEIEAFGFPTTDEDNRKTYLLGKLPIADAFIAWGHSAGNVSEDYKPGFLMFHVYCLLVVGVLGLVMWTDVEAAPSKTSHKHTKIE